MKLFNRSILCVFVLGSLLLMSSCRRASSTKAKVTYDYPVTLTEAELLAQPNLLGGIYAAYPGARRLRGFLREQL